MGGGIEPTTGVRWRDLPIRKRIMLQVERASNGCWLWTGAIRKGYGAISVGDRLFGAHRVSYKAFVGPIPAGLQLDHLCRTPRCVNPDHLEPVTPRENVRRGTSPMAKNAAKTHCKRGHELSGDNLYIRATGFRMCKTCNVSYGKHLKS